MCPVRHLHWSSLWNVFHMAASPLPQFSYRNGSLQLWTEPHATSLGTTTQWNTDHLNKHYVAPHTYVFRLNRYDNKPRRGSAFVLLLPDHAATNRLGRSASAALPAPYTMPHSLPAADKWGLLRTQAAGHSALYLTLSWRLHQWGSDRKSMTLHAWATGRCTQNNRWGTSAVSVDGKILWCVLGK